MSSIHVTYTHTFGQEEEKVKLYQTRTPHTTSYLYACISNPSPPHRNESIPQIPQQWIWLTLAANGSVSRELIFLGVGCGYGLSVCLHPMGVASKTCFLACCHLLSSESISHLEWGLLLWCNFRHAVTSITYMGMLPQECNVCEIDSTCTTVCIYWLEQ